MSQDYYKLLEVAVDASPDDIKKAYRRLALKYHPDRHPPGDTYAEQQFKLILEAYKTLSDTDFRASYDYKLRQKDFRNNTTTTKTYYQQSVKLKQEATPASILQSVRNIQKKINDLNDPSLIKKEVLFKTLTNLLSARNIAVVNSSGDRDQTRKIINELFGVLSFMPFDYVEKLIPNLIKMAGPDNDKILDIIAFKKKRRISYYWQKYKLYLVAAAVIAFFAFLISLEP